MPKGKHSEYERVELPEWFSPSGQKMWMLLYRDSHRIKIGGYGVQMKVFEVLNRGSSPSQSGVGRHGGAHVFIEVTDGTGWPGGDQ